MHSFIEDGYITICVFVVVSFYKKKTALEKTNAQFNIIVYRKTPNNRYIKEVSGDSSLSTLALQHLHSPLLRYSRTSFVLTLD